MARLMTVSMKSLEERILPKYGLEVMTLSIVCPIVSLWRLVNVECSSIQSARSRGVVRCNVLHLASGEETPAKD